MAIIVVIVLVIIKHHRVYHRHVAVIYNNQYVSVQDRAGQRTAHIVVFIRTAHDDTIGCGPYSQVLQTFNVTTFTFSKTKRT